MIAPHQRQLAAGIPVVAVSQRLGHASVSMTLDVYAHVMPATEDRLLTALDDRLVWGNHGADGALPLPLGDRG